MPRYRPNVAAIIEDAEGLVLVGERLDAPGCWQFPQGGVQAGESPPDAVRREIREEIGLAARWYVITECRGPYRYLFDAGRKKEGFDGQEQHYFRAKLLKGAPALEGAVESPEFSRLRWIHPRDFQVRWVASFKRDVYRRVLAEFFG